MTTLQTVSGIAARIFELPNRPPFMVAADLAEVYGTNAKAINQAVRRNPERFPEDFFFILTEDENEHLRSQNVTTNMARALPSAFTHAGALALSGVLKTPVAAEVSVIVHRAFAAMEAKVLADLKQEMIRDRVEWLMAKPIRARIHQYCLGDFSLADIRRATRRPLWEVREICFGLLLRGWIDTMPADSSPATEQMTLFPVQAGEA